MSKIVVMDTSIFDVEGLSVYEQMVYVVIRSFMNRKTGSAFPSYVTIAKYGRMSRRKAIDAVKVLVEKGLIEKELRPIETVNDKQRHTSNLYVIEKSAPSEQDAPPSAPDSPVNGAQELPPSERHAPELKNSTNKRSTNKWNNNQRSAQSPQLRCQSLPNYDKDRAKQQSAEAYEEKQRQALELMRELGVGEKPADVSRQAS
jgi:hypothetical protein